MTRGWRCTSPPANPLEWFPATLPHWFKRGATRPGPEWRAPSVLAHSPQKGHQLPAQARGRGTGWLGEAPRAALPTSPARTPLGLLEPRPGPDAGPARASPDGPELEGFSWPLPDPGSSHNLQTV